MASAFTRLFSPSHRKRNSNSSSSSRRQDSARNRFPTSSTFDLRHSIPEESSSAIEPTFPTLASTSKLTIQHLNDHVSAPISDATLRRRSLAIDTDRAFTTDARHPNLARSFSALDVTSPLDPSMNTITPEPQTQLPQVDDDDDFDSNPLYLQLSEDPQHAQDWNVASLALIPLARTLTDHPTIHQDDLQDPHFVALHALAPSKLYKHQFVGVRSLHPSASQSQTQSQEGQYDWSHVTITATIESDQKTVCITETTHALEPSPSTDTIARSSSVLPSTLTVKRTVSIVGETTIYRNLPTSTSSNPAASQSGFQVTSRAHLQASETSAHSAKVRVVSVDRPIVHRRADDAGSCDLTTAQPEQNSNAAESRDHSDDVSISELIHEHIPSKRIFAADLALLFNPSAPSPLLAEALSNAFQVLFSAAHQFTASFVYVKGFDTYNAHRIRRGIWFKAWKAFEERLGSEQIASLSVEAFHRIKALLENTVMGLVHTKMYDPIQDQLLDADLVVDEVLSTYFAYNVTLADFDVENPALKQHPAKLAGAIDTLIRGLQDDDGSELDEALAAGQLALLKGILRPDDFTDSSVVPFTRSDFLPADLGLSAPPEADSSGTAPQANLHRRTPLQILQALRATIDEIGWAAERLHPSSTRSGPPTNERPPPLGTDDLLPVLSYVFVRARPSRLCSMLYYARTFQLTDTATSPELQWALVTCDAVVTYLRTDPLHLCRRRSVSSSIVAEPSWKGSQSQQGFGGAGEALSARSLSSRSHQGSTAASSMQATTTMARTASANGSASVREVSPPLSPQSPPGSIDPSTDQHSSSGNTSGFFRHSDVSSDFVLYPTCETSPRLQAEGFKLPGLPASVSSNRNSRILQQRPVSVFSLSEDGDTISLLQDTSLEVFDRRSSLLATQSPSRRIGMRDRAYSSSSTSTTHNDVQIRPQIVRTIKRSQTGNVYTSNRLERTSSNGSTASSSQMHVRVVGSPSIRATEGNVDRIPSIVNASPSKSDRRRSFDSWTAFSLFSKRAASGSTDASSEGASAGLADSSALTAGSKGASSHRAPADTSQGTFASFLTSEPVEKPTSAAHLSVKADSRVTRRQNSAPEATRGTGKASTDHALAPGRKTIGPESDDINCQPEGVEMPQTFPKRPAVQLPASVRSTSSRASADLGSLKWPTSDTPSSSRTGSLRSSQRRYRGRFLSTSSATLAVSAAPLPPQVDRTAMSTADLARPQRTPRQSIGSLHALRATMNVDAGTTSSPVVAKVAATSPCDDVPEMIPYGGDPARQVEVASPASIALHSLSSPKIELHAPSVTGREALSEIDVNSADEGRTPIALAFPLKPTQPPRDAGLNITRVAGDA